MLSSRHDAVGGVEGLRGLVAQHGVGAVLGEPESKERENPFQILNEFIFEATVAGRAHAANMFSFSDTDSPRTEYASV